MHEDPRKRRFLKGERALEDLRETLAPEGLAVPPIPADLVPRLVNLGRWAYATAPIHPQDLYFPHRCLERVPELGVENIVAFCHAGHGINSYSLNYLLRIEHLLLFVQVGWGGVYLDSEKSRDHWNQTVTGIEDVLRALGNYERTMPVSSAGVQVVSSHFRHIESVSLMKGPGPVPIPQLHCHSRGEKSALVAAVEALEGDLRDADGPIGPVSCVLVDRWGEDDDPSVNRMREVAEGLFHASGPEHTNAWLEHVSGWVLIASNDGRLIWEEPDEWTAPRHLRHVNAEKVLALWIALSEGRIDEVSREPWLPGKGGAAVSTNN